MNWKEVKYYCNNKLHMYKDVKMFNCFDVMTLYSPPAGGPVGGQISQYS